MRALLFAAFVACASASDTQFVKSVKGGHSSYQYKGGDTSRFYGVNSTQHGFGGNNQSSVNFEVGVCYIEVPTISLAKDPSNVPAGNGSRPDLSRIRTCCKGYMRNVYNFRVCDPVCAQGCINGLCTAPDTCTCYPDHVRNLAGICVATCPIGCQNGHCSGGECLCNEGYKLDRDSKFCMPSCGADCDRIGNCTAPNTCACKPGESHPICRSGQPVPGSNQPSYPGSYQPSYPGGYQPSYPGGNRPHYPGSNQPSYPGGHQPSYPGRNPPSYPGGPQPSYPDPNNPQHGTFRPTPDTIYVNPQQNPNHPFSSDNQKINNTVSPNQYPYQTPNPLPLGHNLPNSTNQGHLPHQTNQEQNPQQIGQYPYYPTYPINQNYPLYPGNQISPNPSDHGQHPQNPNHSPANPSTPDQGAFNTQYPPVQTFNITIPGQYPLYPANQVGPNPPNQMPNQPGNSPYHPSDNQGPYSTYPYSQGGYPYPNNPLPNQPQQGGSYPHYRPGYPSPNSTYPNQGPSSYPSYPGGPNNPYGQQPYDSNQNSFDQSKDSSCSEPCVNGVCMEHNQCRCNPGYVRDEDDSTGRRCLPHCPGGCLNGYCASPYSCACNEGYSKDTSVKGRALCIKRIRRSVGEENPINVAELLVFQIPDEQ